MTARLGNSARVFDQIDAHASLMSMSSAWDPLLESLANFTSAAHLESQIKLLYDLLDTDNNSSLDFAEMSEGLANMKSFKPSIMITLEDFDTFSGSEIPPILWTFSCSNCCLWMPLLKL